MVLAIWDISLGFSKSLNTPGLRNLSLVISRCQQWSLHPFWVSDYTVCRSKDQVFEPWGCRVVQIAMEGNHHIISYHVSYHIISIIPALEVFLHFLDIVFYSVKCKVPLRKHHLLIRCILLDFGRLHSKKRSCVSLCNKTLHSSCLTSCHWI